MEAANYRMAVSTAQDFVTTAARAELVLLGWLAAKNYDVAAFEEGRNEIAGSVTLDRDSVSGRDGAHTRWRLRETVARDRGTWLSTLVVRADPYDGEARTWLQLDVEHRPKDPAARPVRARKPRLTDELLDTLDARDGPARVTATARLVGTDGVDDVIEELCDGRRRLPLVVASTPGGAEPGPWAAGPIRELFGQLAGLAILYVLTADAAAALNRALEFHAVRDGAVRTYLPEVDPAWKADAQRHPLLSRGVIEADPRAAARRLEALPRERAARLPLPIALDTLGQARLRPRPSAEPDELAGLREENRTLNEILVEAEQAEAARADEIRALRRALERTTEREYDLLGVQADLYDELRLMRRQLRDVRAQLALAGRFADIPPPRRSADEHPGTFGELLDRMGEFASLRFTGNTKITRDLDDHGVDNWVATAWEALAALDEFAAAAAAGVVCGDFRQWCSNPPPGSRPFSAGKVKMKESATVSSHHRWRRERTFPVPLSVARGGAIFMPAHVRIGGGNMVAPRLHFHDGTSETGLVYVGYLGPHLTNTRT